MITISDMAILIIPTLFLYLFFPISLVVNHCSFKSTRSIAFVSILNSVFAFVIFSFLHFYIDMAPANTTAAFLYGYISYNLLKKFCYISSDPESMHPSNDESIRPSEDNRKIISFEHHCNKPSSVSMKTLIISCLLTCMISVFASSFLFKTIVSSKTDDCISSLQSSQEELHKQIKSLGSSYSKLSRKVTDLEFDLKGYMSLNPY